MYKLVLNFYHSFNCKFSCFWVGISYNKSRYFLKYFLIALHLFRHSFLVEFLMHPFQLLYINWVKIMLVITYLCIKRLCPLLSRYCILILKCLHDIHGWSNFCNSIAMMTLQILEPWIENKFLQNCEKNKVKGLR